MRAVRACDVGRLSGSGVSKDSLVIFSPLDATLCTWPWAGAKAAGDKVSSPPRSPSSTQDEQPHSPGAGWGLHPHWRRPHPAQGV